MKKKVGSFVLGVFLAAVIGGVLGLVGCATAGDRGRGDRGEERAGALAVGKALPPLSFEKLGGQVVSVADYKGKVVLLDVWASWCGPCKQELPTLDDIAHRLGSRGVEVLAVSIDQDKSNVNAFLKARKRWNLTVAHDPRGAVAERLQPDKMPTSYLLDRHGIVRHVQAGFVPADARALERRLSELAAETI